ncbi:hypothetical protein K438DRAFT_1986209 [Mycena galopus ATCC 62051]|nr:hypothetical protein K438DRAFT_1986209 [Mycena galopus ATCC 62051]
MSASPLHLQEFCDLIAGFVKESKWDLRACSLVTPELTSAAQRYLFAEIIFNRGCLDIDDPSLLELYDEVGACGRLCSVLRASPHLVPFIRRMRVSLEPGVLQLLSHFTFNFSNLHDIVFHRRRGGPASEETIVLAAQFISSPSIRRVGLLSPIFNGTRDLSRLFEKHTPALDSIFLKNVSIKQTNLEEESVLIQSSRVRVKNLHWWWHADFDPATMLDSLFPFDLSALEEVDFGMELSPTARKVIESSRLSIRKMTLDAQQVLNEHYVAFIAHLPALTHLTLVSTAHKLQDAETLLANLPQENRLRSLTLQINKVRQLNESKMRTLGAVCAKLHESCGVNVCVRRFASGADGADTESVVRAAFAELDERGKL